VLDYVAQNHPSMPVAVITAHGSAENAVAALKAGAFDYLAKPVSLNQLRTLGAFGAETAAPESDAPCQRRPGGRLPGADRGIAVDAGHAADD